MVEALIPESFQPRPEAVKVRVCGHVQGVGYRRWLCNKAAARGIVGWVRNIADGSVEAKLAGPAEALKEVVDSMKIGPSRATVDFVRVRPISTATRASGFRIRKSLGMNPSTATTTDKADRLFATVHQRLLQKNSKNPLSTTPQGHQFWKRGFLSDKIRLYNTSRHSLGSYLSDIQREMTRLINGPARWIINDKLAFEMIFGNVVDVPHTVLAIEAGQVSSPYKDGVPPGEFFAKPVGSGGGTGVFAVSFDGHSVTFGGRKVSWEEFLNHLRSLGKGYLLCQKIEQHSQLASMYAGSTNTVRVLMMRHPETWQPIVAA